MLLVSCEDRERDIRYRVDRLCSALGIELERGWLARRRPVVDQTRQAAELLGRGPRGEFGLTLACEELAEEIERTRTEVPIVDSASDVDLYTVEGQ